MGLVDIQKIEEFLSTQEKFELTFEDDNGYETKIQVSRADMWQIAHYCHNELSLAAQKRKGEI